MKSVYRIIISTLLLAATLAYGQVERRDKLAQTGMKFLSVSTDAGISAMAGAATALEIASTSMFYNPAAMGFQKPFAHASVGQVRWIADISYVYGSAAFRPFKGKYGVFGFTAMFADYGDFKGTIRDPGEQGFVDTGLFSPSAFTVGIGYAKALSDKFSVGGNVKYVRQDLGSSIIGFNDQSDYVTKDYMRNVMAFDLGVLYRTGFESLTFGMCVRNFSEEVTYEDEGFQLPLTFKIGFAMNVFDLFDVSEDVHALRMSIDAVHPRDYKEQINVGLEYMLFKMLALRAGYSAPNDEKNVSAGAGIRKAFNDYMLAVDYAYTPFGVFSDVHRFSLQFTF